MAKTKDLTRCHDQRPGQIGQWFKVIAADLEKGHGRWANLKQQNIEKRKKQNYI